MSLLTEPLAGETGEETAVTGENAQQQALVISSNKSW